MASGDPLVAFRTGGDPGNGLGHVIRCLALARRLTPPARCVFVMGAANGRVLGKVTAAGHGVMPLGPDAAPAEVAGAIERLAPQAVVADLPEADPADLEALRGAPLLVVIDDLGRAQRPADLVVNGTVVPRFRAYPEDLETQFLLGPCYMILREEFTRCGSRARTFPPLASSVVVSLGGADRLGLTAPVVRALDAVEQIQRCLIVAGPLCDTAALDQAAEESHMTCWIATDPPAMAPLLYGADLALTCGGMTLYEAAAVGTPAIALPQSEPQVVEIEHFVQQGAAAALGGGLEPDLTQLASLVRDLAADPQQRREMSQCARDLVDGRGARRVAAAILERLAAPAPR